MEGVGVDAQRACATGDIGGREQGKFVVEGGHRGPRDGVNDDYAEVSRRLGWVLRE
jgi:hypothetical protein